MTSLIKQLREVGALLDLDCGDNSCVFSGERGGIRTNGSCSCNLVEAVKRIKELSALPVCVDCERPFHSCECTECIE